MKGKSVTIKRFWTAIDALFLLMWVAFGVFFTILGFRESGWNSVLDFGIVVLSIINLVTDGLKFKRGFDKAETA